MHPPKPLPVWKNGSVHFSPGSSLHLEQELREPLQLFEPPGSRVTKPDEGNVVITGGKAPVPAKFHCI